MSQFSIAIIGGGGISRAHINAAKASEGRIVVAAVVDPSAEARAASAQAAGAEGFESIDKLFASALMERVNGLVICTPPSARLPYVEAALQRRIPVLTEKPLAHRLPDAKALADLAAKNPNVVTAIGYCHRFTPAVVEMKHRIAVGEIGEVIDFGNTFVGHLPHLQNHWMSDPAVSGGGVCIDTASHGIDLFHHLAGPAKFRRAVFHHAWPGRGETSAKLFLQSDHIAGAIESSWLESPRFTITIVGTTGLLHYDYSHPTELVLCPTDDGPEQKLAVETHEVRFARQLAAFADAANGKTPSPLPATFTDGLKVAQVVDDAIRCATRS